MSSRITIKRSVALGTVGSSAQSTFRFIIKRSLTSGSLGSSAQSTFHSIFKRSVALGTLGSSAQSTFHSIFKRSVALGTLGSSAQSTFHSARLLAALRSTYSFARRGRSAASVHRAHRVDRRVAKAICAPSRRPPVSEQIQAVSQPQLSRHKIEIAIVATVIMLLSIAGVLGVLPLMPEQPDAANGTAFSGSIAGDAEQTSVQALKVPVGNNASERLSAIDNMTETTPVKAELFNAVGVNCLSLNDINGAAASFRRALQANPNLIAAQNNMGMAMLQDGDKKAAREAFESALKLQPENSYASSQLQQLSH